MRVEYRTEAFQVKVTEDEAMEAYKEYKEDFGWESFAEDWSAAADVAARVKLNDFLDDAPDDIEFEASECTGVWLESEGDEP